MAKHTYTVASEEGATRYGHEVGETVDIDIPAEEARSVVAAGWLEKADEEPAKDDKAKEAKK